METGSAKERNGEMNKIELATGNAAIQKLIGESGPAVPDTTLDQIRSGHDVDVAAMGGSPKVLRHSVAWTRKR